jgi:hypothetical protein
MSQNTRQTNLLVQQDWTKVYQAFANADFTSYDFETLRSSMITYIKTYYADTYNDFLESSEYIALIDLIAFLGQSLAFRTDLNARENFIDTAQRRDSILKLARMLSYNAKRNSSASGLLKINSIRTTETIIDSTGVNLSNTTINWNDIGNENWLEQFNAILNASLINSQAVGKSGNSKKISGIQTDEYTINLNTNTLPIGKFTSTVQGVGVNFEAVSATTVGKSYIYEVSPAKTGFNILYRNDNNGNASNNTGFFLYFKQGSLQASDFTIASSIPNTYVNVTTSNINDSDHWLYALDVNGSPSTLWTETPAVAGINVIYNQLSDKNIYQLNTLTSDQVSIVFGDGSFSNIPSGPFRFYYRVGIGSDYTISPDDISSIQINLNYINKKGNSETLTLTASLKYTVTNASSAQTLENIKTLAPQQYYTQNRMVTGEDYNIFPQTTFNSIQKIKTVNRTSSGVSLYLDALDPTGSYSSTNIIGTDGILSAVTTTHSQTYDFINTNDIYSTIYNSIVPIIGGTEMKNYYYEYYSPVTVPSTVKFLQTSSSTGTCSGYLQINNVTQQVGGGVTNNLKFVNTGAILKFLDPTQPGVNYVYAVVLSVVSNGDEFTPSLVTLGANIPSGFPLYSIMPAYKTALPNSLIATVISQIRAQVNFGLTYDQNNQIWTNIPPTAIGTSTNWLLKFNYNLGSYQIQSKNLSYTFGSAGQTSFYYDPTVRVYDSQHGVVINDTVSVLSINTVPNTSAPLGKTYDLKIYNVVTAEDGYVDTTQVYVTFPSTQMDGVPDNFDIFLKIVGAISTSVNPVRNNLYFNYRHNVPARNRIDPTPINIMDMYILTYDYATSYINWLRDTTGTITEPAPPTSSSLEIAYGSLDNYKTISDTIIYNPAKFKPLFGAKAKPELRARFQIVKNPNANITDNEIKSKVITSINNYFQLANWDFGDTFYFSELAAYLHTTLAPNIASALITPANQNVVFGNFFQINSDPWEIITSAATVNDIDVVSAVTAATLNLTNGSIQVQ